VDCLVYGMVLIVPLVWHRYYTLSIILGTVAFSYGSVPMYKMVCHSFSPATSSRSHQALADKRSRTGRSAKQQAGAASPSARTAPPPPPPPPPTLPTSPPASSR
jgi:hypothetical protein